MGVWWLLSLSLCPPRVWDGVLSSTELRAVAAAGAERGHSFTAVLDRRSVQPRSILESSLLAIADEIGDEARFLEYWWRSDWISMGAHRDIDEALCRSKRLGDAGVQRCPTNGHVLYVSVEPSVRGPTVVWEEEPPNEIAAAAAMVAGGSAGAGPPRKLAAMHIVPAKPGRLLRFSGEAIHAVPKPALQWLQGNHESMEQSVLDHSRGTAEDQNRPAGCERCVILFNTWAEEPPTLPPANAPVGAKEAALLAAMDTPPKCRPRSAWKEAPRRTVQRNGDDDVIFEATLLGDMVRRGCSAATLSAAADREGLRVALVADEEVSAVTLRGSVASAEAVALAEGAATDNVTLNAEEEFAMRMGFAEQMEADFWGVDGDNSNEDDGWDDE